MSRRGLVVTYAVQKVAERFHLPLFGASAPLRGAAPTAPPRRRSMATTYNLVPSPRRDVAGLAAFDALRAMCRRHVLASLCIRVRTQQVATMTGAVVAKSKRNQSAEQSTCDEVMRLLAHPDGATPLSSWLAMLVRDALEIDAPTVYCRRRRDGDVAGWDVIDGATIKPILDDYGRIVAYQQTLQGVALATYLGRRVDPGEELIVGEFGPGEIRYQPLNPSTHSPYGRPPMEDLLELAQLYLRKLNYDLAHFTEGNIPAALGIFDGSTLSVEQVAEFEDYFNARVVGDVARGAKIHFVPFPIKVERLAQLSTGGQYESAFEERNVKIVCAHYGVTPSEIGFTADVNRATAEAQENVTYRVGIRPLLQWLKAMVLDPIIQDDLGLRHLEWLWNYGESEDREMIARVHALDIEHGVITPQESRAMRYPDLGDAAPGTTLIDIRPSLPSVAKVDAPDAPPDADERERWIDRLRAVMRVAFGEHGERIVAAIADAADVNEAKARLQELFFGEEGRLAAAVLPVMDDIAASAVQSGNAALAVVADWGGVNEDVLRLARENAQWWAAGAAHTSDKAIAQAIADWIAIGGDMPSLIKRVMAISDRWREERSDVGAITEVTRLYAKGNLLAWRRSGLVKAYRIETAADELVCPYCRPRRGKQYNLDDDFNFPPFHARCRCWIVPVVKLPEELFDE